MTKTGNPYLGTALRGLVLVLVVVAAIALVTGSAISDDKKPADKPAKTEKPGLSPEDMAKLMAMGAPSKYHEHLKPLVGQWEGACTFWMAPGEEPQTSRSTMKSALVFGGKFLKQEYKGVVVGMPFEGIGYFGYDNYKKKFTSVWIDSMGTGIYTELGSCDESGKVFTMSGMMDDCMTGQTVKTLSVLTMIGEDKQKFVMSKTGPDGKMLKCMEIVYTRKK